MGNVNMEASQINYRGGSKKMSVEEAIKAAGTEITPEEKEWIDTIPELASQEIIAPEFDAEEGVYAVGDLVIYQGGLYQFTTAHETAGAWNAEEVAAVKVSDEIDSLKSGLNNQTVPQLVTTVTLASGLSGTVTCVKVGQLVLVSGYCSGTIAQNDEIIQNLPAYRTDFGIQDCRYPAILDGNIISPMLFTASNALSVVTACSSVNFFVMYVTN